MEPIDKLVELIKEQDLITVKSKKDKYRWQKIQSQINKIEALELLSIEVKGGDKNEFKML